MGSDIQLRFSGAAGTVDGVPCLVETGTTRILVDRGWRRRWRERPARRWLPLIVPPDHRRIGANASSRQVAA